MAKFLRQFEAPLGFKLTLIGARHSGKTCLLHQWVTHEFSAKLPSTWSTSWAAKRVALSGSGSVAVAVWDTPGSPHFEHLCRMYVRGADVALVCYDCTSRQHWERLKTWVQFVRSRHPCCQVYLVATKADLLQPHEHEGSVSSTALTSAASLASSPREAQAALGARQQGQGQHDGQGQQEPQGQQEQGQQQQPLPPPQRQQEQQQQQQHVQPLQQQHVQGRQVGFGSVRTASEASELGAASPVLGPAPAGSSRASMASPASSPVSPILDTSSPLSQGSLASLPDPHAGSPSSAGLAGPRAAESRPVSGLSAAAERPDSGLSAAAERPDSGLSAAAERPGSDGPSDSGRDEREAANRASVSARHLHFALPEAAADGAVRGSGAAAQQLAAAQPGVPEDEAALYAASIGARLFTTSAKTGEGVAEMFQAIAEECCQRQASAPPSPARQRGAKPQPRRGPWHHWEVPEGERRRSPTSPGPSTPLRMAPTPTSFPAPGRHSSDSSGDPGSDPSGRRPGIVHSAEWGERWPAAGAAALLQPYHAQEPLRRPPAPQPQQAQRAQQAYPQPEYVMDEWDFAAPGAQQERTAWTAGAGESSSSSAEALPQLDYHAKDSCAVC